MDILEPVSKTVMTLIEYTDAASGEDYVGHNSTPCFVFSITLPWLRLKTKQA